MKIRRIKARRATRYVPRMYLVFTDAEPSKNRPRMRWNTETGWLEFLMPYTPASGETFRVHLYSAEPSA